MTECSNARPMPEPLNPFAPPKASLDPQSAESLWRDGRVLVMRPDSPLPTRCVKCNAPALLPLKRRKLYWHPGWVYLLVLLNPLIYLIAALIVRKHATLSPGLCDVHRKRHWLGIAVGWGGSLLALFLMFLGATYEYCSVAVIGMILFLGAVVAGILVARVLQPERIDKDFIRLKGCGQAFLDTLPQFYG